MPNTVTSPNMNLVVPVPGVETGPQWATDLYDALFTTIDQHNHSSGKGVQVPTAGLNVNADLTFSNFNATSFRSTRYTSQSAALALGTDIGCLYNLSGDAYWNNNSGTAIQLTKNGAVNAAFTGYNIRSNVTGTFTILSTDTYVYVEANTSGGTVTINLPASSTLPAGRYFVVADYLGNSEAHSISLVPNGTDTINGANSTYVFQQNFGSVSILTDGAGKWFADVSGEAYLRSTGLQYTGSLALNGTTGVVLQQNGVTYLQVGSSILTIANPTALGTSGGPTISTGTGAPSSSAPNGSVYFNTSGSITTAIYVRQGGVWNAISSSLVGPVASTQVTITSSYTIDSGSPQDYQVNFNHSGAINVTLPAPTQGRTLVFKDMTGNMETNQVTIVRHGSENLEGLAASRVLNTNFGSWTVTSQDGTNWVLLT